MNIHSSLQKIGLKKNEARVYTALLKQGLTNVGPIVRATKLHRQLVYEALETLVDKGLASFVIKNNRKHFQASAPTKLMRLIEQKEQQVKQIMPELMRLQTGSEDRIEVRTLYGQKGFFENLKVVVESAKKGDGVMRIIGGARDVSFYNVLGDLYPDYTKLLSKSKVKKHLIAPEEHADVFRERFVKEHGNVLKTMKLGLSSPTYTRITQDMVSIEIYAADVTVIQIHNRAIAKGYLEHFELLWKMADKS